MAAMWLWLCLCLCLCGFVAVWLWLCGCGCVPVACDAATQEEECKRRAAAETEVQDLKSVVQEAQDTADRLRGDLEAARIEAQAVSSMLDGKT